MPNASKEVTYKTNGGPLRLELLCGEAQLGTYSLRLIASDGVAVIKQARGSFIDDIEDRFELPDPVVEHDGREIRCRARVWQVPPHDRYSVQMTLSQSGKVIGQIGLADKFTETTEIIELTIRLTAV